MLWWLVDHAEAVYFILGLAFLAVAVLFWQTKRGRELVAMVGILAAGVLIWFLFSLVITDRKQIRLNMDALAQAALKGEADKFTPLLAKDFRFQGMMRTEVGAMVVSRAKAAGVNNYFISDFQFENLAHDKNMGKADASFRLRVDYRDGMAPFFCKTVFVIEEGQWRLQSIKLYNPAVEMQTPLFE